MSEKNPYLETDRRMVGDIYTSTEVMDNLTVLCDDFGARFAGTPQERQAAEFIVETFRRYGLENARLEEYPYAGWSRGRATLEVVEPVQKEIPCISLPYCPAGDITVELISVGCGSPGEYEELGDKIKRRAVIADSSSPPDLGRWVHRKEKFERCVLGEASAFIFVSQHPGVGPETGSLQNDRPAPIPGISVCLEDGKFLKRLMDRKGTVRLRLRTTDVNEPRVSWNAVADLPGGETADEMVLLGCHYDGHDISQGAVDPASGMTIVMEVARVLGLYGRGLLKRTVRFVGFGTEEIGLTGAKQYIVAHEEELDRARFMFNLDAAGSGSRKGVVLHNLPELEPFFKQAAGELGDEVPIGQKVHPYSDHFPFLLQGVASAHMGDPEAGPSGRGFGHTAYDTLDKVKLEDLRRGSSVGARLMLRVGAAADFPGQRRSAEVVREIAENDPGLEGYRVSLELAKRRGESTDFVYA